MHNRAWLIPVLGAAVTVWLLLSAANLYYGELNQDEGWYLYTARLAAEGQRPYRDFAFTQGPVFLAVYAQAQPLIDRYGVMGGRLFTGVLGLAAVLMAGLLAARLARGPGAQAAAAIAIILLLCNVYHSYFSLVVKTYSLCAVFIMGGALYLTGKEGSLRGGRGALFAGLFFALAAGVRLSAGVWLPLVGFYLLWRRAERPGAWLYFGAGGALGLLIAFGPSIIHAPEQSLFWLVQYHAARDAGVGLGSMVYKAGFMSRLVQAYFVPAILVLILIVASFMGRPRARYPAVAGLLWVGALVLSLIHIAAPFPYEDYQVLIMPLFAALIGSGLVGLCQTALPADRQQTGKHMLIVLVLLASIAAALSSPLNQAWVLRERDRVWWRLKDKPDLAVLQETAAWLRAQGAEAGEVLLTQDAYLAVEMGMKLPAGMEMGPFSYYPDWSREQAEQRRVLNHDLLLDLLKTSDARWAAFSGYGLAIRSPAVTELTESERAELWAVIHERYELINEVPHFGQAQTTLRLFRRKNTDDRPISETH